MLTRIRQYPARFLTLIVASTLLLTAFGVPWTELQLSAISTFAAAGIALFLEGNPVRKS